MIFIIVQFFRSLRVIDPKKFFTDKRADEDVKTVWNAFACSRKQSEEPCESESLAPGPENLDGLLCEMKKLLSDRVILGENLTQYLENYREGFTDDGNRNLRIDVVWQPLLEGHDEYPLVGEFLRRACSVYHGTAGVEGAINNTRNTLGITTHTITTHKCFNILLIF